MSLDEKFRQTFRDEAAELLAELEDALLSLETRPDDTVLVERAFRALHTLKGSGAMFGFETIVTLAHETETIFNRVRRNELRAERSIVDLALSVKDAIRALLDGGDTPADEAELIEKLRKIEPVEVESHEGESNEAGSHSDTRDAASGNVNVFRIRFRPHPDVFRSGTNPVSLLDELRELGECEVVAHARHIPSLDEIDAERCYVLWDIILVTPSGVNALHDVFAFVEHESELTIERLRDPVEEAPKRLGVILVERGDIRAEEVEEIVRGKRLLGQMLVEAGLVSHDDVRAALAEQRQMTAAAERQHDNGDEGPTTIRVNLGKLDSLVNLVGELVTAQARLARSAEVGDRSSITSINEEIERHVVNLRGLAMEMRMVPIGETYARFFRLVRDLSRQLDKDVELVTEGSETELDKRIIDKLVEPLTHLIRNAIDHGIEAVQARAEAGKASRATVRLSAEHSAGMIRIHVADDGRGLDEADILERAVENGVVPQDASLSREEIFALVFEPGFSTAAEVTDLSGRGVGMDIVRRTVDALNGSLSVQSERSVGTTVTMSIPLTLAIMDGLLVRVNAEHYVLPLASVLECIELREESTRTTNGRRLIEVREKLIPYLSLRDEFSTGGTPPPVSQVVIAETGDGRVGLAVDEVIGQTQAVVKTLGSISGSVAAVSAATILGDGTVALVLDIPRLVAAVTGAGGSGAVTEEARI